MFFFCFEAVARFFLFTGARFLDHFFKAGWVIVQITIYFVSRFLLIIFQFTHFFEIKIEILFYTTEVSMKIR